MGRRIKRTDKKNRNKECLSKYLWELVRYFLYHGRPWQPRRRGLWHAAEAVLWKYIKLSNTVPAG